MKDRIEDKIKEICIFLEELEELLPADFEEYRTKLKDRAACERIFEKIVEAVVNLSFILVRMKKLGVPEDDKDVFKKLENGKIITSPLSKKLQEAKGMRNILAHEYGKVNDELVYHSLTAEIIPDVEEFLKQIKLILK